MLRLIRPSLGRHPHAPARALVAAAGLALVLGATELPNPTCVTAARDTLVDQWLPEWQFGEYHERRVRADPQQAFAAIKRVRASDIFLFRTLTCLRGARQDGQSAPVHKPPEEKPILDVALAGGFILLGQEENRELLLGAVTVARDRGPSRILRP